MKNLRNYELQFPVHLTVNDLAFNNPIKVYVRYADGNLIIDGTTKHVGDGPVTVGRVLEAIDARLLSPRYCVWETSLIKDATGVIYSARKGSKWLVW